MIHKNFFKNDKNKDLIDRKNICRQEKKVDLELALRELKILKTFKILASSENQTLAASLTGEDATSVIKTSSLDNCETR